MKKAIFTILVAAPLAAAQAGGPVDKFGANAIASADMAAAETAITAYLANAPVDPPALLNLGYVYRQTGRALDANALYFRVLSRQNVPVTAADGRNFWSHDLARAGLKGQVTVATR